MSKKEIFKHVEDIDIKQEKISQMIDSILDIYRNNPDECHDLLIECESLKKEYSSLREKFIEMEKEV